MGDAMTALMPRLFGDVAEWFDVDFPLHPSHLIRVEDELSDQEYRLRAELPGLDPEQDVQVSVSDGLLTINAERRAEEHTRGRSEFRYGMLRRTVRLPANADREHIKAGYDKGVLEVTVPLTAPAPDGRKIPVTSG
jgi:HSP20 family molecular chaperone IbpA